MVEQVHGICQALGSTLSIIRISVLPITHSFQHMDIYPRVQIRENASFHFAKAPETLDLHSGVGVQYRIGGLGLFLLTRFNFGKTWSMAMTEGNKTIKTHGQRASGIGTGSRYPSLRDRFLLLHCAGLMVSVGS